MTIHASKGLEFPVVFIAGAEDGIIPHERSIADGESFEDGARPLEEERRLFYVAITRAREKLYITSCLKRRRRDAYNDRFPSPFLTEIPQGLIECMDEESTGDTNEVVDAEDFFASMKKRFGG
jgi:DNA helicase-2/ATP-dependent DNA helicase PcrA